MALWALTDSGGYQPPWPSGGKKWAHRATTDLRIHPRSADDARAMADTLLDRLYGDSLASA
jgi:hypothetical protein